jgi:hypothetical protein
VYNGFDPGDHGRGSGGSGGRMLTIVYTGWVYQQHTLAPLFDAVRLLAVDARNVRIIFYGSDAALVRRLAEKFGIGHLVETRDAVSFMESLRRQREADVLLYLSWNDPAQTGIFSGKLLQYFGARRPILAVGNADNVPARVILERRLGFVSSDSREISRRISDWISEKRKTGEIEEIPVEVAADFSRENQTRRLEKFLARVVRAKQMVGRKVPTG